MLRLMSMKICSLVFLLLPLYAIAQDISEYPKAIYEEINMVRSNPQSFVEKYDLRKLKRIKKSPELIWDDKLAKVAQEKAEDMAKNDYFDHVDPKNKGLNYYLFLDGYPLTEEYERTDRANNAESIVASTRGPEEFVKLLIVDKGVPDKGHRKHLLGLDDFNAKHTHIGVGVSYNADAKFGYYCSILIVHRK
ncbi:MAG: hypothetical protein ACJAZ3_000333 [Sphingobacteriales bacterium]|jgi:uncharacterized protein YkwD